jgi:hypothetical protein
MLHLEDCISWEMYSNLVSSKGNMHEVENKSVLHSRPVIRQDRFLIQGQ